MVLPYLGGVLGKEGAQAAAKGFLDRCFEASIEKVSAASRLLHCLLKDIGGPQTACVAPMPCYGRRICRLCHLYLVKTGIS